MVFNLVSYYKVSMVTSHISLQMKRISVLLQRIIELFLLIQHDEDSLALFCGQRIETIP